MDEKICVNASEAAALLGVSRKYLYQRLMTRSDFPLVKIAGRNLIPVDALRKWISAQQRGN